MNPLLNQPFSTPFQTPPFSQISNQDFLPAFRAAIDEAKEEINQIVNDARLPTFENTIEALALNGQKLSRISSIFFNLNSAETNEEIQQIAQEVSPLLSEFSNDVKLNSDLFKKIKYVNENQNLDLLTGEQKMLLRKTFKNFSRNGALLASKDQENLRNIDKELAQLQLQFGQNVLAEINDYQLHLTDKSTLDGLPEDAVQAAQKEAENRDLKGWVFTLQIPSLLAFMKYAKRRDLRKELYLANGKKAFRGNNHDNQEVIKKIVQLRFERAQLLGYETHADFVLEERMAKNPKTVADFLEDLRAKAYPMAQKEINELGEYARRVEGIETLMPWDHAYYSEKLKQEKFDLSEQELKPYFSLENVRKGAFEIAEKLYNIQFKPNKKIEVYHPEVEVFEVFKENEIIGLLYTDFFPRKGKRAGAWMTSYRDGHYQKGVHYVPQISIVCNFTPPANERPSLLTFNEVTTLFHEFGHALHGLLANTTYEALSGTNVHWDFVELPSQFMENYCYEAEALELFAKHYETQEVIPMEMIEKIRAAGQFLEAYQTIRQLSFGRLDMAWHALNPNEIEEVSSYEKQIFELTDLYPSIAETCMSTAFSHIFQGGYSAGYYSYKWAEVLDADAFAYFKQNGIFDAETAQKFYTLLSSGGTVNPMDLYVAFRGQKPNPSALLERAGILSFDQENV